MDLKVQVSKGLWGKGLLPLPKGWERRNLSYLQGKVKGVLYVLRTSNGNRTSVIGSAKFLQQNPEKVDWRTGQLSKWARLAKEGHKVTQFQIWTKADRTRRGVIVDDTVEYYGK